jgi:hypothetical protein
LQRTPNRASAWPAPSTSPRTRPGACGQNITMSRTVSVTSEPAARRVQRCPDTRAGAAAKRSDPIAHSTRPRQGLGCCPQGSPTSWGSPARASGRRGPRVSPPGSSPLAPIIPAGLKSLAGGEDAYVQTRDRNGPCAKPKTPVAIRCRLERFNCGGRAGPAPTWRAPSARGKCGRLSLAR